MFLSKQLAMSDLPDLPDLPELPDLSAIFFGIEVRIQKTEVRMEVSFRLLLYLCSFIHEIYSNSHGRDFAYFAFFAFFFSKK
jgi:hypothetical protein